MSTPLQLVILLFFLLCLRGVAAQTVTLETMSPQPSCSNQVLIYSCRTEFPSVSLRWVLSSFSLGFVALEDAVGDTESKIDGRVVAILTENEGNVPQSMMASTLTIHPPLNDLNGTNLNGTNVICEGSMEGGEQENATEIDLTGNPSQPENLSPAATDATPSATVVWDSPQYTGGNQMTISKYRIQIPTINYSMEESGNESSHTITADGINVMFNTPYVVKVTTVNICDDESDPANTTVIIEASEPPEMSLCAVLMCGLGKVELHWKQETQVVSVYTPPTDSVSVEVDGPAPVHVSPNECFNLSQVNMSCSFNISEDGIYVVKVNTTNAVGTTPVSTPLDLHPLIVNNRTLTDVPSYILVSVNSLCQDDTYYIMVMFGTQPKNAVTDCNYKQPNVAVNVTKSATPVYVPEDIVLGGEEKYCYCAELGEVQGRDNDDKAPKSSALSVGEKAAIGIVCTLAVIICLILSAIILWSRLKEKESSPTTTDQAQDALTSVSSADPSSTQNTTLEQNSTIVPSHPVIPNPPSTSPARTTSFNEDSSTFGQFSGESNSLQQTSTSQGWVVRVPKPRGIFVNNGEILVSNALGPRNTPSNRPSCPPHSVVVFDEQTGKQLNKIDKGMNAPRGIAVDFDTGFIYVASSRDNRILKFSKTYSELKTVEIEQNDKQIEQNDEQIDEQDDKQDYQLKSHLFAMCIIKGQLYVANNYGSCVEVLSLDLQQPQKFGENICNCIKKRCGPTGIAFDSQEEHIYVTYEECGVNTFDLTFTHKKRIKKIKRNGQEDITLDRLRGIAVWLQKRVIFVTEPCNNSVVCFTTNEVYVGAANSWNDRMFSNPQVVAIDPGDHYLYLGDDSNKLHRIELNLFFQHLQST